MDYFIWHIIFLYWTEFNMEVKGQDGKYAIPSACGMPRRPRCDGVPEGLPQIIDGGGRGPGKVHDDAMQV